MSRYAFLGARPSPARSDPFARRHLALLALQPASPDRRWSVIPQQALATPAALARRLSEVVAAGGEGLLSVSCSDRAILQWDRFSIGQGETAQFLLEGNGAVLNRVMGGSVSEILGLMQSNGVVNGRRFAGPHDLPDRFDIVGPRIFSE